MSSIPAGEQPPLPPEELEWLRTASESFGGLRDIEFVRKIRLRHEGYVVRATHEDRRIRFFGRIMQMSGSRNTGIEDQHEELERELPFKNWPHSESHYLSIAFQDHIWIPDPRTQYPFNILLSLTEIGKTNLSEVLNRGRPDDRLSGSVYVSISYAIDYIHNRLNGAHLDICPQNIMVDLLQYESEHMLTFKLCNFGTAIIEPNRNQEPMAWSNVVTTFRAPECEVIHDIDATPLAAKPMDIYSFGRTIYEMAHSGNEKTAHLIRWMLNPDPSARFTIDQVLRHDSPFQRQRRFQTVVN